MERDKKFESWLKRQGKSNSTIDSYSTSLRLYFEAGFHWTFEDACIWKEKEIKRVKPATVNIRIHALNSYAQFTRVRWRLKPIKLQNQQFVENQLTVSQYEKLLHCLLDDGNLRWWAAIKILACTGVRISEFLQIRREDLKVGYVDVCGKGTKYRRVWFGAKLRQEVLSIYKEDGPILPYNAGVIRKRLHAFAKKYRLQKEPLHPHEFRAFYARRVYEKSHDLKFLQDLLGHADIKTTVRYLRKTSKGISRRISKIVTWWDITGVMDGQVGDVYEYLGAFQIDELGKAVDFSGYSDLGRYMRIHFHSSRDVPIAPEIIPSSQTLKYLLRIDWDIIGRFIAIGFDSIEQGATAPFNHYSSRGLGRHVGAPNVQDKNYWSFCSSRVIPVSVENIPVMFNLSLLLRISWDITGKWQNQDGFGPIITSSYFGHIPPSGAYKIGGSLPYADEGVVNGNTSHQLVFDSSLVVPSGSELYPASQITLYLLRVAWDITGKWQRGSSVENTAGLTEGEQSFWGAFYAIPPVRIAKTLGNSINNHTGYQLLGFDSARVIPMDSEIAPTSQSLIYLLRIAWDIYGQLLNVITTGRPGTGAFTRTRDETRYAFSQGANCYYTNINFDSSRVVSTESEVKPFTYVIFPLLRILWADSLQSQLQGYFRKNKEQF